MKLSQQIIEAWIKTVHKGTFAVRDCWLDLCIESPEARQHLRVILLRCEEKKLIVKSSTNGHYRIVESELIPIEWKKANIENVLPILLPFDIHKYAKLYPKSIVIVAGVKNQGKSAFLYETIRMNMDTFNVVLFNSETGAEQMKERFEPLNIPDPPPFQSYEKYDCFADVLDPEALTVIDYLDFDSEVYLAGAAINEIFKKLTTGACIIGMQMPPPARVKQPDGSIKNVSRDLAYGGAFTAKRAALYITLAEGICKLVHVKNPAMKGVNPNNRQWSYRFDQDGYFTDIKDYHG